MLVLWVTEYVDPTDARFIQLRETFANECTADALTLLARRDGERSEKRDTVALTDKGTGCEDYMAHRSVFGTRDERQHVGSLCKENPYERQQFFIAETPPDKFFLSTPSRRPDFHLFQS